MYSNYSLLADPKVFTGSSTGQVTSINDRDDIVRLEELNLGLCLPHGCGTDETRVQLFRNKALVDSVQFFKDAICIDDLSVWGINSHRLFLPSR